MARPLWATTILTTDTTAASATIGGGITAGTGAVAITDTSGKLAVFDSTHYQNLSGANFTSLTATNLSGQVPVANGGTNIASYAVGDILYASGSTTLSKLADVAAGSYLRAGGVTTAPVWSTLILPNAATSGNVMYASATNTAGFNANFNIDANGLLGIGGVVNGANLITIAASTTSGTDQRAISIANLTTTSAATSAINGYYIGISTAAASYSTANLRGYQFGGIAKGSGHTITRAVGFQSVDFTTGTNNALVFMGDDSTFTGNWAIYQNTTHASYFSGGINANAATDPGAGNMTASAFIPAGSTIPTTGLYLPSANTLGWAANSAQRMSLAPQVGGGTYGLTVNSGANGTGSTVGSALIAGRNSSGNGAPGLLTSVDKTGAAWDIWADSTGVARIISDASAPHESGGDTVGTIIGTQTSTRDTKRPWSVDWATSQTRLSADQALADMVDAPIYDYKKINDPYGPITFTNTTIEDAPWLGMDPDALHPNGRSFNPETFAGRTMLAFRAITARLDALEAEK
jgi:hypothetical protein